MKLSKFVIPLMMLLLSTTLSSSVYADDFYEILDYQVHVDVKSDNSYEIIEQLLVEFSTMRHGIYREIPIKYNGRRYQVKGVRVYDPTTMEPYTTKLTNENGMLTIRIGDADTYVEGQVNYAIAYTYVGGIDYNKSMDEFYFNLIGNRWNSPIYKSSFEITMPEPFDADQVNFTSGSFGSTNTQNATYSVDGETIKGAIKEPLLPYEGLTVALPLPEGYYEDVGSSVNMFGFYFFILLMFGLCLYAYFKNRQYHNKNLVVPVISFEPPKELNSAEAAYIYQREIITPANVASLILKWASDGYLTIEEEAHTFKKDVMIFSKIKSLASDKPAYERTLFNSLFHHGDGNTVTTEDLQYHFYEDLNTAVSEVKDQFLKDKEILINKVQILTKVYALLLALFFAIGFGYVANLFLRTGFFINFIAGLIAGMVILIVIGVTYLLKLNPPSGKVLMFAFGVGMTFVVPLAITILAIYGQLFQLLVWNSSLSIISFLLYILLYIGAIFAIISIKDYTVFGLNYVNQLEGFREFIKTAKLDQMEALFKKNPSYFYDILPYAMVLGITSIWEKNVDAIAVPQPDWYYSSRPFYSHSFVNNLSRSFNSASAPPPSSGSSGGSSGGGFSGGGGGGGGGGSW